MPRLRILLAEDNEFNQQLVASALSREGHQVTLVRHGREAVETTSRERFDLVLMDVQMPEMDGLQATAAIRAREGTTGARLPIVAMTARDRPGDAEACLAAGMDGYLDKPLRRAALLNELARVLGLDEATPDPKIPVDVGEPALDQERLLAEAGGDWVLLRRLVQIFAEEVPPLVSALERAVTLGDPAEVAEKAHAIKSLAGHWRRRGRAHAAAERLETMGRQRSLEGSRAAYQDLHQAIAVLNEDLRDLLNTTDGEGVQA